MPGIRHFLRPLGLCLTGLGMAGCATTTNMRLAQANAEEPVKILVVESPMAIAPGRLKKVFAPDTKPDSSLSNEPIGEVVKHAQEYATVGMRSALAKQTGLAFAVWQPEDRAFADKVRDQPFGTTISQAEADRIRARTGADALFRFDITDYGLTPNAWRKGYITFEVVSTLAVAGVIAYAGSAVAKDAAGVYLAQEAAEETASTYAGFWAVDVGFRPVRIEAELIQLNPVETVWRTSDTGLSDLSVSRLTGTVSTVERDAQLNRSTNEATRDIASALAAFLKNPAPPGR